MLNNFSRKDFNPFFIQDLLNDKNFYELEESAVWFTSLIQYFYDEKSLRKVMIDKEVNKTFLKHNFAFSSLNTKNLKIIIMTGSVDAVDAIEARRAGADDYTVKTVDCKTIAESVAHIIIQ